MKNLTESSAEIYEFPAGGRAALRGRRYSEAKAVTEFVESAVNLADCSGSWYHEAAIKGCKS